MSRQLFADGAVRSVEAVNRAQLKEQGWTIVHGITSQLDLLAVALSVGRPKSSPTGEIVKLLIPRLSEESRDRTLSGTYGTGQFPLHTDTAFWPLPSRYLVFRATGDIRRATTLLSFAALLEKLGTDFRRLAERSIWSATTHRKAFYCSMVFKVGNERCWRYDSQCMSPANKAASQVRRILDTRLAEIRETELYWTEGTSVVVDNWKVLHGRGPMPVAERQRTLERIYVE